MEMIAWFTAPCWSGSPSGCLLGLLWARSRPAHTQAVGQGMVDQAEVMQGLDRLSDQMHDLDQQRAAWQGQLHQQVDMRTDRLRRETQSLSTALRKPQVRGRWGELHLRRAVELAGLVDRCDFSEQVRLADGARCGPTWWSTWSAAARSWSTRRCRSTPTSTPPRSTTTTSARRTSPATPASCASTSTSSPPRRYWRSLAETPEFVVLFVPAESFLAAALETDPQLIEYAAARQIVLATPTTLIALLRTVAHGWSHEALADQAREIHRLGRELHGRLGSLSGHLDQVGRSLNAAVGPLQPGRRLAGVAGAGVRAPLPGPLGHRRRAARPAPGGVDHAARWARRAGPRGSDVARIDGRPDRRAAPDEEAGDNTVAL